MLTPRNQMQGKKVEIFHRSSGYFRAELSCDRAQMSGVIRKTGPVFSQNRLLLLSGTTGVS
jgi:hypothetical protein